MAQEPSATNVRSYTITPRGSGAGTPPAADAAKALVQKIPGAQVQRLGTLANVATVLLPVHREAEARTLLGDSWSLDPNAPLDLSGSAGPAVQP